MKKTAVVLFAILFIFSCSNNDVSYITAPTSDPVAVLQYGSWAKGLVGYTIYMNNGYATSTFSSSVSSGTTTSKITNIKWKWNQLPSGTVAVELQYRPFGSAYVTNVKNITSQQIGSTTDFNNLDARGQINLKFTSYNGTSYPMYRTLKDSIYESYSY
jgi:hypothetical protein